jgi:predicted metal-binding protein
MKVGVIRCGAHSEKCSAAGCFRAARNATGDFKQASEVVAMDTCGGCQRGGSDKVVERAKRQQSAGAEAIHFSKCLIGACPWKDARTEAIAKETGLPVIPGTH